MRKAQPILLSVCIGMGAWGPAITAAADTGSREEMHSVPVTDARGRIVQVQTRICRPAGDAPAERSRLGDAVGRVAPGT